MTRWKNRLAKLAACRSGLVAWRTGAAAVFAMSLGGAAWGGLTVEKAGLRSAPPSLFVQHVSQAGVKACAATYPALGAMVTASGTYNVASIWNKGAPDAHPVEGLVGLTLDLPQYQGPAAGVVFAAPTASGCTGNAVRVIPFSQSCPIIVKQLPAGSRLLRDMAGTAIYELSGGQGQVMLVSSGAGCTTVSVNQIG